MKIENLTIVFVDIKDFTKRTSEQSREDNERLLVIFSSLVRPIVKAFGGKIIKSLGDAYLITFHSPTDTLHCSMAIQDNLANINSKLKKEDQLEIRIAINVGEVRLEDGDIFGESVNIASRIESITDGGEIYFSEAVYLIMNKSEVPFEEIGPIKLKGVPEAIKIFRVPKINEVGQYRLKGEGKPEKVKVKEHSLEPPQLPYGGFALERIKDKLPKIRVEEQEQIQSLKEVFTKLHYESYINKEEWFRKKGIKHWFSYFIYIIRWLKGAFLILFNLKTLLRFKNFYIKFWIKFKNNRKFQMILISIIIGLALIISGGISWRNREIKLMKEKEIAIQQAKKESERAVRAEKEIKVLKAKIQKKSKLEKQKVEQEKKKFKWFWEK